MSLQLRALQKEQILPIHGPDEPSLPNRLLRPRRQLIQCLSIAMIRHESMSVVESTDDERPFG